MSKRTSPQAAQPAASKPVGTESAGQAVLKPAPEGVSPRQGLLTALGLHGLSDLDRAVLAALATEAPMLLIGPHGSAKSAMLERLAAALELEHRHYNASLISFDDLVGFPVPDGDGLRYLRTPATLWDAQSVFIDEISRCRPEVQNKFFSIIHERRVQGIELTTLRYRWSAMNPPPSADATDDTAVYMGSMPLEPALADRFAFVLALPALEDLPPEARRDVIRSGLTGGARQADDFRLSALVERCRREAEASATRHGDWITAYTAALVVPLRQAGLPISGRRAAMLAANIASVHAARLILGDAKPGDRPRTKTQAKEPAAGQSTTRIADSALIALRHSLPHRAEGKPVDAGVLTSVHRQAADAAGQGQEDAELSRILDEANPVRRVGIALKALKRKPGSVPRHTMSLLVSDAMASQPVQARWILTQELLPDLTELDCVDAPTLELLGEPFMAQVHFEQRSNLKHDVPRSRIDRFNTVVKALDALDSSDPTQVALGNLGVALYQHNENAAEPTALARQQQTLRMQLQALDDHAA